MFTWYWQLSLILLYFLFTDTTQNICTNTFISKHKALVHRWGFVIILHWQGEFSSALYTTNDTERMSKYKALVHRWGFVIILHWQGEFSSALYTTDDTERMSKCKALVHRWVFVLVLHWQGELSSALYHGCKWNDIAFFFYIFMVIRHKMYIKSKYIIQNGNRSIQTSTNQYFVMFPFTFKTFFNPPWHWFS